MTLVLLQVGQVAITLARDTTALSALRMHEEARALVIRAALVQTTAMLLTALRSQSVASLSPW